VPADSVGLANLLPQIVAWEGPVFMRLCRNKVPVVFGDLYDPQIGTGVLLRNGMDVTLIDCGVMVARCLEAAQELSEAGVETRVVEMHTIKPLDGALVMRCAAETGVLVQ